MSTTLHVCCMDHQPPLVSEAYSRGDATPEALEYVRNFVANRAELIRLFDLDLIEHPQGADAHTFRFLQQHAPCAIGIIDETGGYYRVEPNTPVGHQTRQNTPTVWANPELRSEPASPFTKTL